MGRILIVDSDPIFSTVLEDRVRVAGHEPQVVEDSVRALTLAIESPPDLIVLEVAAPVGQGLEVVRALRAQAATRAVPILVLSESALSADRVAALRAGADDTLAKPCDFEELGLRAERLMEQAGTGSSMLQGDLTSHPMWELMQYLAQAGKTGELLLRGAGSFTARVRLREGRPVGAKWESLPPGEALLAVFGLKQGRFEFTAGGGGGEGEPLSVQELMLESAWLDDELESRLQYLPSSGTPLHPAGEAPPVESPELQALPLAPVYGRIAERPGVRIFDLLRELSLAPQKVRLAVAWMVEHGYLTIPEDSGFSFPNTTELTSLELTEMAITELLSAARGAGFGTSALPFLLLVEPGHWPELMQLVESVPGFTRHRALQDFAKQLRAGHRASVAFPTDHGKLMLHVRALDGAEAGTIEAIVTVSAGVFLWLGEGSPPELVRRIVERLESVKNPARGLVVASRPAAVLLAEDAVSGRRRWRQSTHVPKSLLGVLRLLRPRPG